MQRKFLTLIILVSLAFFSCWDYSLPSRIELEVEGSVDLPVKIATSNWSAMLLKSLRDIFSEGMGDGIEGVEVYDVNYNGQDAQAFCVYIPIKISEGFNPNDYLDGIADFTKDGINALGIDTEVTVPSIGDFSIECPIPSIDITIPPGSKITDDFPIPFSSDGSGDNIPNFNSSNFLHAVIGEGFFTIELDLSEGNVRLSKEQFDFIYDINISQFPNDKGVLGNYFGLSYPDIPNPPNRASDKRSLNGQNINTNQVKIDGTVTIKPKQGGGYVTGGGDKLEGKLIIKMNISEYKELDLDFNAVSDNLKIDPFSVPLADAAKYLNHIKFAQCADDGKKTGIGININFKGSSKEIINALAMSIKCDALKFNSAAKPLNAGNNIFGNTDALTLDLKTTKELKFEISLLPSGANKNVLHLTNLTVGKPLNIQGDADLFQHWIEAEVNIKEALGTNAGLDGTFPDESEPIDLSSLNDYLEGFIFMEEDIKAAVYLNGPAIGNLDLSIDVNAKYGGTSSPIIKTAQLGQTQVVIADYLKNGIYKYNYLPDGGTSVNFVDVINARPKDLVFNYKVNVSETITITPDMFDGNNGSAPNDITATIMLLLHMRLTADSDGSWIGFPDMFKDQDDLLGRKSPEEDSIFTSLNVDYIKFSVNFTSPFFTGGKLFIEKDIQEDTTHSIKGSKPILFPDGIPVDGSGIAINITNKEFDIIKDNLINPDFRLVFKKDGKITIPRTIGVTSVRIEAKGKTSVTLGF
jgi:hypothetical protein